MSDKALRGNKLTAGRTGKWGGCLLKKIGLLFFLYFPFYLFTDSNWH